MIMSDEDTDIYEDLPTFKYDETLDRLQTVINNLNVKNKDLYERLLQTSKEKEAIETKCVVLTSNISSLLKTAQAEIKRKDKAISELREKLTLETNRKRKWTCNNNLNPKNEGGPNSSHIHLLEPNNRISNSQEEITKKLKCNTFCEEVFKGNHEHIKTKHLFENNKDNLDQLKLLKKSVHVTKIPTAAKIPNIECKTLYSTRMFNKLYGLPSNNIKPQSNKEENGENNNTLKHSIRKESDSSLDKFQKLDESSVIKNISGHSESIRENKLEGKINELNLKHNENKENVRRRSVNMDKAWKEQFDKNDATSANNLLTTKSSLITTNEDLKIIVTRNRPTSFVESTNETSVNSVKNNFEEKLTKTVQDVESSSFCSYNETLSMKSKILNEPISASNNINASSIKNIAETCVQHAQQNEGKTQNGLNKNCEAFQRSINTKINNLQNELNSTEKCVSPSQINNKNISLKKNSKSIIRPISSEFWPTRTQNNANSETDPLKDLQNVKQTEKKLKLNENNSKISIAINNEFPMEVEKSCQNKNDIMEALFGSPVKWAESSLDETPPSKTLDISSPAVYEDSCSAHIENIKFSKTENNTFVNNGSTNVNLNHNLSNKESEKKAKFVLPFQQDCIKQRPFKNLKEDIIKKVISSFAPRITTSDFGSNLDITQSLSNIPPSFEFKNKTDTLIRNPSRYEDSLLGQFEDTTQFISALTKVESKISPLNTPSKSCEGKHTIPIDSIALEPLMIEQGNTNMTHSEKPINILCPRKSPRIINKRPESPTRNFINKEITKDNSNKSKVFALNDSFISQQEKKVMNLKIENDPIIEMSKYLNIKRSTANCKFIGKQRISHSIASKEKRKANLTIPELKHHNFDNEKNKFNKMSKSNNNQIKSKDPAQLILGTSLSKIQLQKNFHTVKEFKRSSALKWGIPLKATWHHQQGNSEDLLTETSQNRNEKRRHSSEELKYKNSETEPAKQIQQERVVMKPGSVLHIEKKSRSEVIQKMEWVLTPLQMTNDRLSSNNVTKPVQPIEKQERESNLLKDTAPVSTTPLKTPHKVIQINRRISLTNVTPQNVIVSRRRPINFGVSEL